MFDAKIAISQLKSSAKARQLVTVVGTGSSIALTGNRSLSWKGLVENGFDYGLSKGKLSAEQRIAWGHQLKSNDLDDLISAAEFMGRKLGAPNGDLYARWLENIFKNVAPEEKGMANALRALQAADIPICTLNYDTLLERVTGLRTINLSDTAKVIAWMRREEQGILHLHGTWDLPSSCILGIRDYQTTIDDDVRNLIQRALVSFGRILFIGCGDTFSDPNFSALINWLRDSIRTAAPQHYALVSAADETRRHADPSWHGFVEPLSFGLDYKELPAFLLSLFPTAIPPKVKSKAVRSRASSLNIKHTKTLSNYRTFLLRDCGQMTIEGVRADMETAQRRFDLEQLFVPLKVEPTPPEISFRDPEREKKLRKWEENNKEPVPFGRVFEKHKHLALLALPGGGKTLLLKRLAIAYADASRRGSSSDELPELDIIPVIIRCREWKEYITRPILMLLRNMAAITGQPGLIDLSEALVPLLKKGQVLLLVDGLDEIHDDGDRTTFVQNLENFLDEYKHIRLVVTSREAGFSLVAPAIARFCERWKVAPLEPNAIRNLCHFWHRLMIGEGAESQVEAREVADRLLRNPSLRRLAENPLLLTMLLVVKRGAGRLPPDRVSLYDRAVEVLLDTWNIQGHEPLNLKEAVPQLACVAYELMRQGKQTATEKELLSLLEEAREKVPQIRRYAKDTPAQFLKRVELRSSLLVEGGHQFDGTRTVPFYQFRHLTFQEHLAAVASVDGNYLKYEIGDTVLNPLVDYLLTEEWKEVVPMAAVLAKKQAEPLLAALVEEGERLRQELYDNKQFLGKDKWGEQIPAPIARLAQCLAEEAEASPEILTKGLQLVAVFARGCRNGEYWQPLSRGPYSEELLIQTWKLYENMSWPAESWIRNTLAALLAYRKHREYWNGDDGQNELARLLQGPNVEDICKGILTVGGLFWTESTHENVNAREVFLSARAEIERHMFDDRIPIVSAALWTWVMASRTSERFTATNSLLDRFLYIWVSLQRRDMMVSACYALAASKVIARDAWKPVLTEEQAEFIRTGPNFSGDYKIENEVRQAASLRVAFHARSIWSEEELAERLTKISWPFGLEDTQEEMLRQMGEVGLQILRKLDRQGERPGRSRRANR